MLYCVVIEQTLLTLLHNMYIVHIYTVNMFAASLPTFMAGMVLAWPSPVMKYISDGRAPVLLTPEQTSWMIACIDVGNFVMAVPAGWLMDRMGRKFIVNMSTPLMFAGWMLILYGRQVRIAIFLNRYNRNNNTARVTDKHNTEKLSFFFFCLSLIISCSQNVFNDTQLYFVW